MVNFPHNTAARKHQTGIKYDQINSSHTLSLQKSPRHSCTRHWNWILFYRRWRWGSNCFYVFFLVPETRNKTSIMKCTDTFVLTKSHLCMQILALNSKPSVYMWTTSCICHTTFGKCVSDSLMSFRIWNNLFLK